MTEMFNADAAKKAVAAIEPNEAKTFHPDDLPSYMELWLGAIRGAAEAGRTEICCYSPYAHDDRGAFNAIYKKFSELGFHVVPLSHMVSGSRYCLVFDVSW